jgi:uncharacterized spore protein YtfJ
VSYGFGFGGGRADSKAPVEDEVAAANTTSGSGMGGGGGAGISVRPMAVLEMTGAETKIRPVVDVTRLAIAGMLLVAWNVFWITYTVRRTYGRR